MNVLKHFMQSSIIYLFYTLCIVCAMLIVSGLDGNGSSTGVDKRIDGERTESITSKFGYIYAQVYWGQLSKARLVLG